MYINYNYNINYYELYYDEDGDYGRQKVMIIHVMMIIYMGRKKEKLMRKLDVEDKRKI